MLVVYYVGIWGKKGRWCFVHGYMQACGALVWMTHAAARGRRQGSEERGQEHIWEGTVIGGLHIGIYTGN